MTYTSPTQHFLKNRVGTDASVLAAEFGKVERELNSVVKVARVSLTGGNANAIAFAWQNPEAVAVMVQRVLLYIVTQGATASSVMDIGIVADATSTADTLLDGVALTAAGLFDNVTNKGTNGKSVGLVDANGGTNDFITGKILVANAAELVGNVYIEYVKV